MQNLASLSIFALAAALTPGPNNTLLMLSGAKWGFKATLPLLLGIVFGFPLLVFAVGMGLGGVFRSWPVLHTVLKVVCFGLLLALAWKIARAGGPSEKSSRHPVGFLAGAALQWVNPKAWMMAVSALAVYVPVGQPPLRPVLIVITVFFLTAIPSSLTWAVFGTTLTRFLNTPRRAAIFNVTMAVLLVASMLWSFI
jgi:threonine/homoserine/homoserine lactone efflux protein